MALCVWSFMKAPFTPLFITLDVLVNLIILLEVVVRITALGWKRFWELWINRFDVVIVFMCWVALIVFASSNSDMEEDDVRIWGVAVYTECVSIYR